MTDAKIMLMDMWMVFRFLYIKEAEEEHVCCYRNRYILSESLWARMSDVQERMSQLKQFLIKNWNKPYPPFGLMLTIGALTEEMLESTSKDYDGEPRELLFGYSSLSLKKSARVDFGIYLHQRATLLKSKCWVENKWLRKMVEGRLKYESLHSLIYRTYEHITFSDLEKKKWFKFTNADADWFLEPRHRYFADFIPFCVPDRIGPYFEWMIEDKTQFASDDDSSESEDDSSESEDESSESEDDSSESEDD